MKVYVEAQSKAALIRRLAAGEEISGYNYSMFGGAGHYMLDDSLEDGTIIAIYSQMSQGNPVAKSWGTWTNGVLKAETFEAFDPADEYDNFIHKQEMAEEAYEEYLEELEEDDEPLSFDDWLTTITDHEDSPEYDAYMEEQWKQMQEDDEEIARLMEDPEYTTLEGTLDAETELTHEGWRNRDGYINMTGCEVCKKNKPNEKVYHLTHEQSFPHDIINIQPGEDWLKMKSSRRFVCFDCYDKNIAFIHNNKLQHPYNSLWGEGRWRIEHWMAETFESPVSCKICGKTFDSFRGLNGHMNAQGKPICYWKRAESFSADIEWSFCMYCHEDYDESEEHHCPESKGWNCITCGGNLFEIPDYLWTFCMNCHGRFHNEHDEAILMDTESLCPSCAESLGAESFSAEENLKGAWHRKTIDGVSLVRNQGLGRSTYKAEYKGITATIWYQGQYRYSPCWRYWVRNWNAIEDRMDSLWNEGCYKNGMEAVKGFKKDVDSGKIIIDVKSSKYKQQFGMSAESFSADSSERCFACGCAGDGKGDNPGGNELIYCELCEDSWCDCCREPSCADKHEWYFCTRNAAESFSAENRCSVCGASSHNERSCPYGPDTSFTTNLPRTLGIMGMVAVIAGGAYIWTQRATNGGKQDE